MSQVKASLIIPVYNEWKHTALCVHSIEKYTTIPYEVILVDNGSTKPMPSPLRQQKHVRVVRHPFNRGFAAATNRGLQESEGKILVWLNNDTVPCHGWLDQLIKVLDSNSKYGMVGPVSNRVIKEQKIHVKLKTMEQITRFTQRFNKTDPKKWRISPRLSGFCIAMKRNIYEQIGELDERFGLGLYEDDDYSLRVRNAGYQCVVAGDTYVHHFGSTSFNRKGYTEFKKILHQNRRYYMHKWDDLPIGEKKGGV